MLLSPGVSNRWIRTLYCRIICWLFDQVCQPCWPIKLNVVKLFLLNTDENAKCVFVSGKVFVLVFYLWVRSESAQVDTSSVQITKVDSGGGLYATFSQCQQQVDTNPLLQNNTLIVWPSVSASLANKIKCFSNFFTQHRWKCEVCICLWQGFHVSLLFVSGVRACTSGHK